MNPWRREPAVSGRFYPADRHELERELERCMGKEFAGKPARVAIGPHAGTMYSGVVAGTLYARISVPKRVIVLSPNHTGRGARFALWLRGVWATPLGEIPVDEALANRLARACSLLEADRQAHLLEHSLELHLPFLQARQPDLSIVPLTLGYGSYEDCEKVGAAIAQVVREERDDVLIVASTDMSHYIAADEASKLDQQALAKVTAIDDQGLYEVVREQDISMCGIIPTTTALAAARTLGLRKGELLRYGHSGEVTGDSSSVVGYASVRIY